MIHHDDLSDSQWNSLYQFVKFCFVGFSNTIISLGIYYLVIFLNSDYYIIGNCLGFIVSVINSYYWNSNYVFNKKNERKKTIAKTFLAYGSNILLSTFLLRLTVENLNISKVIAPLLILMITIPLNFFLNKFFVMK
ncbi:MAG: GtrA family protein [Lachnospiraceae bacterium]|nr:GtrA family protein [Lachnospiraceae bacterium]